MTESFAFSFQLLHNETRKSAKRNTRIELVTFQFNGFR